MTNEIEPKVKCLPTVESFHMYDYKKNTKNKTQCAFSNGWHIQVASL